MSPVLARWVFLAQLGATLYMTGLIWFVQVVHYPLMEGAAGPDFSGYEKRHMNLTTWVVGPPMLVEAVTAVLLFWLRPPGIPAWPLWAGLFLGAVVWLSTAFVQVPCHEALAAGFDPAVHQRLVASNWLRTAAWTLRGMLVLWMAGSALAAGAS